MARSGNQADLSHTKNSQSTRKNRKPMSAEKTPLIPRSYILPFALVTTLFALWGFANDITNPLVAAFRDVFVISNTQSAWIQTAFYGGYATMALPAALFIRKFSYKSGILLGLALYATGAMIAIPAAQMVNFNVFLVALYVLTFGLAFLETTANPYILSMGDRATATRRLNLAQAFNPIGSLTGMTVASLAILSSLHVVDFRDEVRAHQTRAIAAVENTTAPEDLAKTSPELATFLNTFDDLTEISGDAALNRTLAAFKDGDITAYREMTHPEMQRHDLDIVKTPYVIIGLVVIGMFFVFLFTRMPDTAPHASERLDLRTTFAILIRNRRYREGVVAQAFYVGAQIMCWTFIIHYGITNLGLTASQAQNYNIIAMVIFCSSRFICTFLLKFVNPSQLLFALAVGGVFCSAGAMLLPGYAGLYSLIAISACMSLMFPTIYGIALDGMGDEAKIASAGLIFAIVGGALMPPLQGRLIDLGGESGILFGIPAVSFSFVLPLACFIIIGLYALRSSRVDEADPLSAPQMP